jgi:hypothetical protein
VILKRYGSSLRSVTPEFNAHALNEIAFGRDDDFSIEGDEFEERFEVSREESLAVETDAPVQKDAEEALLDELRAGIDRIRAGLGEGELLVVENANGVDWPKTRERRKDVIVDGENRFHFHWRVEPPLRLGVYRPRS